MLLDLSNVTSNQFPIDNYELDEEQIETFASLFWFSDFSLEKVVFYRGSEDISGTSQTVLRSTKTEIKRQVSIRP